MKCLFKPGDESNVAIMSLFPFVRGEGGRSPDEGSFLRLQPSNNNPHPDPLSRTIVNVLRDSLAGERDKSQST